MRLDLSPARWIWLPSGRTLANTVVQFRRFAPTGRVEGWIAADSRYRLWVGGELVQQGPAPADPRHAEADPLAFEVPEGGAWVGVEVLYYGHGEGTWPFGKPGLLLRADGLDSGPGWECRLDPGRPRGTAKRWYLRAYQERADLAREDGWLNGGGAPGLAPMDLGGRSDRPALATRYADYANDVHGGLDSSGFTLSARSIPLLRESWVEAEFFAEDRVAWTGDPDDWFDYRVPELFTVGSAGEARLLTYRLPHEHVGWPEVEVVAEAGAVVHLMVHEHHDHATTPFLDTHFYAWSRFALKDGENVIRPFDYEAGRWLQLHVQGKVEVRRVGMRARCYPWSHDPAVATDDPDLQAVWDAALRTLDNSAQDIVVDGMGRERQQYSGDGGHQLRPVRLLRGAPELSARFLRQFGHGGLMNGVFLDSWPATDRLQRLWQRNLGVNDWGPIVDHSIGFVFDHFHHWMETGDLAPFRENLDALARFVARLRDQVESDPDGVLPARQPDEATVWMDHEAYPSADHKRCALNLYALAMVVHAWTPLCAAAGRDPGFETEEWRARIVARWWDEARGIFVGGREVGDDHADDRALATAVLYGFNPDDGPSVALLADPGAKIGRSYPANEVWTHRALIRAGRTDAVLRDLRSRWRGMESVEATGTLQEFWHARPDSTNLMSHCPQAPLISLVEGVLGIEPTAPGFAAVRLNPAPGDLAHLSASVWTPHGPIRAEITPETVEMRVPDSIRTHAVGATFREGKWQWIR